MATETNPVLTSVFDQVTSQTSTANQYAQTTIDSANYFMEKLSSAIASFAPPTISTNITLDSPPDMEMPAEATFTTPDEIDISGLPVIGGYLAPELQTVPDAPEMDFGNQPGAITAFTGQAPNTAPSLSYPTIPSAPSIATVATPSMLSISISPFAGMTTQTFDGERPDSSLILVPPDIAEYTEGETYTSTLLTNTTNEIIDRIVNGGTGINATVEQAIWDRERDRENNILLGAELDVVRADAAQGFSLPTGAMAARLDKIRSETAGKIITLGRDIAIKQAEMEIENVKQALQMALALESKLIDANNMTKQRTFEAARYATEAAVQVYNAKVSLFNALVDQYKADAQVYNSLIEAEIAKVKAYEAEVNAEQAKADVNKTLVEQYKAQIEASLATVQIYKTQVDAAAVLAQIEELKLKAFEAEIQGFGAEVNGYTAYVSGYTAGANVYGETVRAYSARSQAYAAQAQAINSNNQSLIEYYRAMNSADASKMQAYAAGIQAQASRSGSQADIAKVMLEAQTAYSNAVTQHNQAVSAQWNYGAQAEISATQLSLQAAKASADLYMTSRSIATDAAKVGAQVSAQLAGSAMNMVGYNMGFSGSYGASDSTSTTYRYDM